MRSKILQKLLFERDIKYSWQAIILLIIFSHTALAQQEPEAWHPVAGQHYQDISGLVTQQSGIKFYFWPGSASSYQLELALQSWQLQRPEIKIQRIPLVKRPHWRLLAKAWLVATDMGHGQDFLNQLYQAIHQQSLPLTTFSELEQFVESINIDSLDFRTRFNSLAINQHLKILQNEARLFPVVGVPAIIINNQWLSDASMATTSAQLIQIIEQLLPVNDAIDPITLDITQ